MVDIGHHGAFGSYFDVTADEPLAAELVHALHDLRVGPDVATEHRLDVRLSADVWTVSWDGSDRYSGPEPDLALYDSLISINQHAARVAAAAGNVVLHGGAVDVGSRAVAFVGHSGAGKSTMTAAMARAGHHYLADEVVAVAGDLEVRPFHRPIGLRRGGAESLGVAVPAGPYGQVHPYVVGTSALLGTGSRLAAVLLLERNDLDAVKPRIVPMTPGQALFRLANQTLGATGLERAMFQRLDWLVRRLPVYELHYADLDAAVAEVEGLLCGPAPLADFHRREPA
jgi:hypothetical protein